MRLLSFARNDTSQDRYDKPLLAIVGPTAVGKTTLALSLAERFGGEIVGADSRQVYRHMDIGTAKATPPERARVSHHLIDIVDPDQDFSLALYQHLAYQAIAGIHSRGRLPLLVGGSGLYVWAVLRGLRIPQVPPDPALRQALEEKARLEGLESLLRELEERDPESARTIDPRNPRRLIRALEVCRITSQPFSQLRRESPPPYNITIIGLSLDRVELYRRIDQRVDHMIDMGLVEEVQGLLERGYSLDLPTMASPGYREIGMYLQGRLTLAEAVQRTKVATHQLARRQYAWFSQRDPRIHWFESREEFLPAIERGIERFLQTDLEEQPRTAVD
ncbi:MAG: tRNA (adenosine(37)-N6)-dimethylallyltransferase MiaA [Dehalococcoidia bacterium]|nr:tRNA (adenosine(37)-N6)-dimethylallyltransferase MiaA [Dehalococcoidia bacterium]